MCKLFLRVSKKVISYAKRGVMVVGVLFVLRLVFLHGLSLHKTGNRTNASYSLTPEERTELLARI